MSDQKPGFQLLDLSFAKRGGAKLVRWSYGSGLLAIASSCTGALIYCLDTALRQFGYARIAERDVTMAMVTRETVASNYELAGLIWAAVGAIGIPAVFFVTAIVLRLGHEVALAILNATQLGER